MSNIYKSWDFKKAGKLIPKGEQIPSILHVGVWAEIIKQSISKTSDLMR